MACYSGTAIAVASHRFLLSYGDVMKSQRSGFRTQQSGFTLVEIAIVLVIIGLLLGGILKGQELINSAKVKNLANDFRIVPTYIYAYQDKYRSLPGDDKAGQSRIPADATPVPADNGDGDGIIEGAWNSTTATDESFRFWRHVRAA